MGQKENNCCQDLSVWIKPKLFKALADLNRLTILTRLAENGNPQSVSEVAQCCPIDMSVVSRHLGVLRDAGIVKAEKKGKEVFYHVQTGEVVTLLRELADALEACCPDGSCSFKSGEGNNDQ